MIPQAIHREGEADEGFELGERLLYLRTPYFSGKDVEQLQTALGALGFACGGVSGTFGAYTEGALRKFQLNMGLVPDGIAGCENWYGDAAALHNAWQDKPQIEDRAYMGFARAADVLESHAVCLFGTEEYTRSVASNMSNLAMATNPRSKMVSAETLLVPPDANMLLAHIVRSGRPYETMCHALMCDDPQVLGRRIANAVEAQMACRAGRPRRIVLEIVGPGVDESVAAIERAAHHDAITLLDAFCNAF